MIIDTSALIAVLSDEPERLLFNKTIAQSEECLISAATYLETSIVIEARYGYEGIRDLSYYLQEAEISVHPVDKMQADIALQAYTQFGKGKHPAGLNFGDCFSYALAKIKLEALLYKGKDFSQTDIISAIT